MQLENQQLPTQQKEKDLPTLDIDDIEEVEFTDDDSLDNIEPKTNKGKRSMVRKNIEAILAERELQRQLAEVFDEDILLD